MNSDGKRTDFRPVSEHDGLVERYKGKNLEVDTAIIFSALPNCAGNPGAAEQNSGVERRDPELRPQLPREGDSGTVQCSGVGATQVEIEKIKSAEQQPMHFSSMNSEFAKKGTETQFIMCPLGPITLVGNRKPNVDNQLIASCLEWDINNISLLVSISITFPFISILS